MFCLLLLPPNLGLDPPFRACSDHSEKCILVHDRAGPQRRLSKLECKTRPCYFWLPRMTKVLLMDCNSHSVWTTGGTCGKVGHVDAMGSAQISQGQSTYHVHPNGLLDKLVMQQMGGGEWGSGCLLEEMHKWEDIMTTTCQHATPLHQDP